MSVTVYKLTSQDNKTRKGEYNETTWGKNVTHHARGDGGLCSDGMIHAYLSPVLAAILNPIHANIHNPKLWECRVPAIDATQSDLKIGSRCLTTVREVPLPTITPRQRIIFAILCTEKALTVVGNQPWQIPYRKWAEAYKLGENHADACDAYTASYAATYSQAPDAVVRDAAFAVIRSTYTTFDAARDAANAAARAALAVHRAVRGRAARAAVQTADVGAIANTLNLVEIADEALTYE